MQYTVATMTNILCWYFTMLRWWDGRVEKVLKEEFTSLFSISGGDMIGFQKKTEEEITSQ